MLTPPSLFYLSSVWAQDVLRQEIVAGELVTLVNPGANHPAGQLICKPSTRMPLESELEFHKRTVSRLGQRFEDLGTFTPA